MKLISLSLHNFRQHLESSIAFVDGVTGVIGPNGSGKTTILEAIAWALYGAPAVRGTNETMRSRAAEGGSRVTVELAFELGGMAYKVSRSLDGSGRTGHAGLEVDGRVLCSGMSEVTSRVVALLGMDYQAFFTSFFTGQKQLEFMSQLEGRERGVAISRMLGYDRLTKARDRANDDRKGLDREIAGLEQGLADPEQLKERRKGAETQLASANKALTEAETAHKSASDVLAKLKPIKEASDQKAARHDELARRLEMDKAELERLEKRLVDLEAELAGLEQKKVELGGLAPDIKRYEEAGQEFHKLGELQKHEGERQRLSGQISGLESDIKKLTARIRQQDSAISAQQRAAAALVAAEKLLGTIDEKVRSLREDRARRESKIEADTKQLNEQRARLEAKRAQMEKAGPEGVCPTCERPLAGELNKVLAHFDAELKEIDQGVAQLREAKTQLVSDIKIIAAEEAKRDGVAKQVEQLREEKSRADALAAELDGVKKEIDSKAAEIDLLRAALGKLPSGFDQNRYDDLRRIGNDLRPKREKAKELEGALQREPAVISEAAESRAALDAKRAQVTEAEKSLAELAFSSEQHEKLAREFDSANTALNAANLILVGAKGEVRTAEAILGEVERAEKDYKSRVDDLKHKRSERIHLETLASAFDKLRAELNDRIRPELESIAGELLSIMTDGRYSVVEISDKYEAMIRDDGELKLVISGGEDDVLNLALRLAVSQMIADRAGQSFSLLVLDEVFGSLDDTRRDNVVALLQNLKSRFEQVILITHVESIHDALDNCLWVEFDEKTKTSRLSERSIIEGSLEAGVSA